MRPEASVHTLRGVMRDTMCMALVREPAGREAIARAICEAVEYVIADIADNG